MLKLQEFSSDCTNVNRKNKENCCLCLNGFNYDHEQNEALSKMPLLVLKKFDGDEDDDHVDLHHQR